MTTENPHAGKGRSVVLDIGDDIGALVLDMPDALAGMEVEIQLPDAVPHVAVVPHITPDGNVTHSAVFFELPEGKHEAYLRHQAGPRIQVDIVGGHVTYATWNHICHRD